MTAEPTRAPRLTPAKRLAFALVPVVALALLLEGVLWVAGVEPACEAHDPFQGFATTIPHFVESPDGMVRVAETRRDSLAAAPFPARKPNGVHRIVCLGGSTTYGRPFDDRTSFPGHLRAMLAETAGEDRCEVINAGAIAYASYRVTGVLRELAGYEPDLFVIYTGQNEFLESRTYREILETSDLLRGAAGWLHRTRTMTLFHRIAGTPPAGRAAIPDGVQFTGVDEIGPDAYSRDDPWRERVIDGFRGRLREMSSLAQESGARVLWVVPASNLADFAPFRSEPGPGRAPTDPAQTSRAAALLDAGRYAEALAIVEPASNGDPRHAGLHFLRGRALRGLGRIDDSRVAFLRAVEEDIVPLRALQEIAESIRREAEATGALLVDFEAILAARTPDGIVGEPDFVDHVHPSVEANEALARAIVEKLASEGLPPDASPLDENALQRARSRIAAAMDREYQAGELQKLAVVLQSVGQPSAALRRAGEALALTGPTVQGLLALGSIHQVQGNLDAAAAEFDRVIELAPENADARCRLGIVARLRGRTDEAAGHFRRALEADPAFEPAHSHLGVLLAGRGDLFEARRHFEEAVRLAPHSSEAHGNLGLVLARQDRPGPAELSYREALRLDPANHTARLNLALLLEAAGRVDEAALELRFVLTADPGHAGAREALDRFERP